MMKSRLLLIVLVTIVCFCFGIAWVAEKSYAPQVFCFYSNNIFPHIDHSFNDLDARDENNQPIKTKAAEQLLIDIFREGLFNLLINSELYSFANAIRILQDKINPSTLKFVRNIPKSAFGFFTAILRATKKFQMILVCLWGFLIFNIFSIYQSIISSSLVLSKVRTIPLVLRC